MSPIATLTLILFGVALVLALLVWTLIAPPPRSVATPSARLGSPRASKAPSADSPERPANRSTAAVAGPPSNSGHQDNGGRLRRRGEETNDAFERFLRSADHER
jgi:hypothetical protein